MSSSAGNMRIIERLKKGIMPEQLVLTLEVRGYLDLVEKGVVLENHEQNYGYYYELAPDWEQRLMESLL